MNIYQIMDGQVCWRSPLFFWGQLFYSCHCNKGLLLMFLWQWLQFPLQTWLATHSLIRSRTWLHFATLSFHPDLEGWLSLWWYQLSSVNQVSALVLNFIAVLNFSIRVCGKCLVSITLSLHCTKNCWLSTRSYHFCTWIQLCFSVYFVFF